MTGRRVRAISPTMALAMWLLWLPNDGQIWRLIADNNRRLWRAAAWPTAATYPALRNRGLIDDDRILTDTGRAWIVDQIEAARNRATAHDELRTEAIATGWARRAAA